MPQPGRNHSGPRDDLNQRTHWSLCMAQVQKQEGRLVRGAQHRLAFTLSRSTPNTHHGLSNPNSTQRNEGAPLE